MHRNAHLSAGQRLFGARVGAQPKTLKGPRSVTAQMPVLARWCHQRAAGSRAREPRRIKRAVAERELGLVADQRAVKRVTRLRAGIDIDQPQPLGLLRPRASQQTRQRRLGKIA